MKAMARDDTDDEDEVDHVGNELFDFMREMQADGDTNHGINGMLMIEDDNGPGDDEDVPMTPGDSDDSDLEGPWWQMGAGEDEFYWLVLIGQYYSGWGA